MDFILRPVHRIYRKVCYSTSHASLGRPSKVRAEDSRTLSRLRSRSSETIHGPRTSNDHADGAAASCPQRERQATRCTRCVDVRLNTDRPARVPRSQHGSCQLRTRLPLRRTAPAVADRLMPRPRLGSDVSFLTLTPNRHGVVQPASPARSISRRAPGLPERSRAAATRPLLDLVRAHLLRFLPARADTCQRHHLCPRSRRLPRVWVSLHCDVLQGKLELGRS
ncbi:hypothetical protein C8T65DRAFT_669516, partial [Cerioporus squamosus]